MRARHLIDDVCCSICADQTEGSLSDQKRLLVQPSVCSHAIAHSPATYLQQPENKGHTVVPSRLVDVCCKDEFASLEVG